MSGDREHAGYSIGLVRSDPKLLRVQEAVEALDTSGDSETAREIKKVINDHSVAAAYRHEAVQRHRDQAKNAEHADAPAGEAETESSANVKLSRWKEMSREQQQAVLSTPRSETSKFNKQTNTSIEWAKWSWNPVTGCLHNCPYCYARDIAHRLFEQDFDPCFLPERLGAPANTSVPKEAAENVGHKNVFTCSMADLFGKWVPQEWIDAVLDVIRDQDQWNYLLLTKFPQRLAEQDWPQNAWVGATVDRQSNVERTLKAFERVRNETDAAVTWLSLEPLLEPLKFESLSMFDMVVLGGASSSKETPEWTPPSAWYEQILWQARQDDCAVYVKDNLGYRPREYPGVRPRTEKRAPEIFFKPRPHIDT